MNHRSKAVIAGALASVVLVAVPASAHYVYNIAVVWENANGRCVENRSEISDGTHTADPEFDNGYVRVDVLTSSRYSYSGMTVECTSRWERGPFYTRARAILHYCRDFNTDPTKLCHQPQDWDYICAAGVTDWEYNEISTSKFVHNKFYPEPPCGTGLYSSFGQANTKNPQNANRWVGGEMYSGSHWLGEPLDTDAGRPCVSCVK